MLDDESIKKLEESLGKDGEEKVRQNFANKVYSSEKIPHIKSWLERKTHERYARYQDKDIELKSNSNKIAFVAMFISGIALVLSIIAIAR